VAALPNPRQLAALAEAGTLLALDDALDLESLRASFNPSLLDQTMVAGKVYGIFTRVEMKSLVWYNPRQFEAKGYLVPGTWTQLNELEQQIIASGGTPWCMGLAEGDGADGTGTDWIEDILLRTAGPDIYERWSRGQILWTDEAVVNAFRAWGTIVSDPRMVFGGPHSVLNTSASQALFPLFENPPQCYLHRQANSVTRFINVQRPDLIASVDYRFFALPPIAPAQSAPLLVSGELFGMFNDTPQAHALIQYLASSSAHRQWAGSGGFLSANKFIEPAVYPDDITRQLSELLFTTEQLHYDASELMPDNVRNAFRAGVLEFIAAPEQLQAILAEIEAIAAGAAPP
jgi:alpha-glucoside transport system substrate-binding protein